MTSHRSGNKFLHHENVTALMRMTAEQRRGVATLSPLAFGRVYLPGRFQYEPSRMHFELDQLLVNANEQRGKKIAIAAPRAHAKTTVVCEVFVLFCALFGIEPYIWLICKTAEQAQMILGNVKKELESNPILQTDFPDVCPEIGRSQRPRRWSNDDIELRNGTRITAFGAGSQERGRKHGRHRPTLIICDDIEDEEEVRSQIQRANKREWFTKTLLHAGTAITNFIMVGTVLHFDSLLANLFDPMKMPGWKALRYSALMQLPSNMELWDQWEQILREREVYDGTTGPDAAQRYYLANREAMDDGHEVLWPANPGEQLYPLMMLRAFDRQAFSSEKQNEPIDPADCYFSADDIVCWDTQYGTVEQLLAAFEDDLDIYGACDPSLGKSNRRGDYSAIITIARHRKTNTIYVIGADIDRVKPDVLLKKIIHYHQKWNYHRFYMEANSFQQHLADLLREQARQQGVNNLDVEEVTQTKDKLLRIQNLQPYIRSGGLQLHSRQTELLSQLQEFPMGSYDDGPDALATVVAHAAEDVPRLSPIIWAKRSEPWWRSEDFWIGI